MPRKHTVRNYNPDSIYHVYNSGANNFPIFQDEQDIETFVTYLASYLTPPPNKEDLKITVEFNGKTLTGVPRQPNNYFQELKLYLFCMTPMEFHLVLYQEPSQSIAKFMQSLNTRYSMYFNRRHGRSGSPFVGKYKAIEITNQADLLPLMHYLHRKSWQPGARSSHQEYLDQTQANWLHKDFVSEFFVNDNTQTIPELIGNYVQDERLNSYELLGDQALV